MTSRRCIALLLSVIAVANLQVSDSFPSRTVRDAAAVRGGRRHQLRRQVPDQLPVSIVEQVLLRSAWEEWGGSVRRRRSGSG